MESQQGREPRDWETLRRWDPERIGPYVVLGRLGSGSMGQVYLGRSAAGRLVAVKTIRVELAEEAGFRTRFAQEVAAARKVSGVFTAARGAVGTRAHAAPAQARGTREAAVASDVYSLGATLLFAATGHPPYSGASVMDVLARLATEEPDLSGLPGELSEVITACLHRVPRQRPTSTAMLVQLGDFTVAQAGPDEEHSYLPDKVMALIAEYQRSPQTGPRA